MMIAALVVSLGVAFASPQAGGGDGARAAPGQARTDATQSRERMQARRDALRRVVTGEVSRENLIRLIEERAESLARQRAELEQRESRLATLAEELRGGAEMDTVLRSLRDEMRREWRGFRGDRERGGEWQRADARPPIGEPGRGPGQQVITPDVPLTDELREGLLAVLEETATPQEFSRLRTLMSRAPERADEHFRKLLGSNGVRRLVQLQRDDPVLFKLQVEQMRLRRDAIEAATRALVAEKAGESEEAAGHRDRLRSVLEKELNIRVAMKQHELSELESRVERERERAQSMWENRDDIVSRELLLLLTRLDQRMRGAQKRPSAGDPERREGVPPTFDNRDRPPPG